MNDRVPRTDEQIVGEALVHKDAFAALVQKYQEPLSRYLRRLGLWRREDVEDVLQETFLKTYRNLNGFDSRLKFSSWIYRIAHNETVSFFRSRNSRPEGFAADDADQHLEVLRSSLDIQRDTEDGLNAAQITEALNHLPAKERDVLVLRYFEEREYADISDILQIPMGTVATCLNRAKKRLRDHLSHLA